MFPRKKHPSAEPGMLKGRQLNTRAGRLIMAPFIGKF
jgi:hypothetical protein